MLANQKSGRNGGMAMEDSLKLLAAILAATVLGVNLSIVRPMKDKMEDLKQEVAAMQSDMQLHVRDARIMTIGGGSSQIMRNVIARNLGLPS